MPPAFRTAQFGPRHTLRRATCSILAVATGVGLACRPTARAASTAHGQPTRFGIGRVATAAEIEAWNIDVRADGRGLPADSGTPAEGATIYAARCAVCHGADGTHAVVPPAPPLVGRFPGDAFPFDTDAAAIPTVGSYWPYATTLFDYVRRAMPLNAPGSLTSHEVYALTAFLLARNGIVPSATVLNAGTLPVVRMPARTRFVPDDRTGGAHLR